MTQPKVDKVIDYYRACKDQISDEMFEVQEIWKQCEAQYLCKKDWGDKEKWQSKTYIPICKPKIKRAARLIKRILVDSPEYFDFEHPGADMLRKLRCNITKKALKVHLNAAKFIDSFAEALESGFVMALMILKFWVATEEDDHFCVEYSSDGYQELVYTERLKLKCKPINPFNFYYTRDRKVVIEDEWITLPELKKMSKQKDSSGNYIYNQAQIKKALSGDYGDETKLDAEEEKRLRRLGIIKHQNKFRKDVLLSHFWGPLINEKNEIEIENCRFIVLNEKYLLKDPGKNPFWHKKPPYVWHSPLSVLFRHVGKGLTEDVRGIEDAINSFVNLQMDNLLWKLNGIREVDAMALDDTGKADLMELYPGKLVKRRTGYQGQAFTYHELGFDPDSAMPLLQELMTFHEAEHGVTSYVEQMAGAAGEKATVYSGKKASAMSDFQSIAKDIERGFLVDCIDMARDLMVQFLSNFDTDNKLSQVFQEEGLLLDQMSDMERQQMIVTDLDFIAHGISVFFDRMEKIEKIGSMVKMYNALPEEAADYIPWNDIITQFHEAFAIDNIKLKSEQEVQQIRQQRQQALEEQKQLMIGEFMGKMQMEREKIAGKLKEVEMRTAHDSREQGRDRLLQVGMKAIDVVENSKDRADNDKDRVVDLVGKAIDSEQKAADSYRGKK